VYFQQIPRCFGLGHYNKYTMAGWLQETIISHRAGSGEIQDQGTGLGIGVWRVPISCFQVAIFSLCYHMVERGKKSSLGAFHKRHSSLL
jgi:hypothetical protein